MNNDRSKSSSTIVGFPLEIGGINIELTKVSGAISTVLSNVINVEIRIMVQVVKQWG